MAPTGRIHHRRDREKNFMVIPDKGGELVVLRNSRDAKFAEGNLVHYDVSKSGKHVKFANRYGLADGSQDLQEDETDQYSGNGGIDLVLNDGDTGHTLVVGRWEDVEEVLPSGIRVMDHGILGTVGDRVLMYANLGQQGVPIDGARVVEGSFPSRYMASLLECASDTNPDQGKLVQLIEESLS